MKQKIYDIFFWEINFFNQTNKNNFFFFKIRIGYILLANIESHHIYWFWKGHLSSPQNSLILMRRKTIRQLFCSFSYYYVNIKQKRYHKFHWQFGTQFNLYANIVSHHTGFIRAEIYSLDSEKNSDETRVLCQHIEVEPRKKIILNLCNPE